MILTFPMSLCSTLSIFCDNTNNSILYLSFPFFFHLYHLILSQDNLKALLVLSEDADSVLIMNDGQG